MRNGGPSRSTPTSAFAARSSTCAWESLSERGRAILRTIGIPLLAGYSAAEVASALGTSPSWVSSRTAELREELRG